MRHLNQLAERLKERLQPSEQTLRTALDIVKQLQDQPLVNEDLVQHESGGVAPVLAGPSHPSFEPVGKVQLCEVEHKNVPAAVFDYLNKRLSYAVREGDLAWNEEWFKQKLIGFHKGDGNTVRFALPRIGKITEGIVLGSEIQTVWKNQKHTAYVLTHIQDKIEEELAKRKKASLPTP